MTREKRCLSFLVIIAAAGCFFAESAGAVIDIYTFRKERVDQELDGNRGYIMGTPPEKPRREPRKRTLIGIDIEIPALVSEPEEDIEHVPIRERYTPRETVLKSEPRETVPADRSLAEEFSPEQRAAERRKMTVVGDTEDYWIK